MAVNHQEITSAGGKTIWGDPSEIGKLVAGEAYDVVLENNGKDLETVRYSIYSYGAYKL